MFGVSTDDDWWKLLFCGASDGLYGGVIDSFGGSAVTMLHDVAARVAEMLPSFPRLVQQRLYYLAMLLHGFQYYFVS